MRHDHPSCSSTGLRIWHASHCSACAGFSKVHVGQDHSSGPVFCVGSGPLGLEAATFADADLADAIVVDDLDLTATLAFEGPPKAFGGPFCRGCKSFTMTTSEPESDAWRSSLSESKVRSMTLLSILCLAALSASRCASTPDAQALSSRILRSAACLNR